jgi:hypothetical protein
VTFELRVARAALVVFELDHGPRVRIRDVELLDGTFDGHALPEIELCSRMMCGRHGRAKR